MRSARVPTPEIEARLGSTFGRLVNVSATGALVRTHEPCLPGHQYPMILNMPDTPAKFTVRVVRAEPTVPAESGRAPVAQYLVGVAFTECPPAARHAVAKLCGLSFGQQE